MPHRFIIRKNQDLYQYPVVEPNIDTEFTIGDLHGNPLKLLHFLIQEGICTISEENYLALSDIMTDNLANRVDGPPSARKEYLLYLIEQAFRCLVTIKVNKSNALVRCMGDTVAERGPNDFWMLTLFDILRRKGIRLTILFSNHDYSFIAAYERVVHKKTNAFSDHLLPADLSRSLINLQHWIDLGVTTKEKILYLIYHSYKPALTLLDYTLDFTHQTLILFSHAPIGLATVESLAKKFNVEYNDSTATELASTIQKINTQFKIYVDQFKTRTLCPNHTKSSERSQDDMIESVYYTIWNREERLTEQRPGYSILYVCGHHTPKEGAVASTTQEAIYLDNNFGKYSKPITDKERSNYSWTQTQPHEPYNILVALPSEQVTAELEETSLDTAFLEALEASSALSSPRNEPTPIETHHQQQNKDKQYCQSPMTFFQSSSHEKLPTLKLTLADDFDENYETISNHRPPKREHESLSQPHAKRHCKTPSYFVEETQAPVVTL